MNLEAAMTAAGGLALFLLAMLMMTEGLEVFAGNRLRNLLARWTSTPVRGVGGGDEQNHLEGSDQETSSTGVASPTGQTHEPQTPCRRQ